MTDTRRQLISMYLTTIVVFSMFAMGVFSGSAMAGTVKSANVECVQNCGGSVGNVAVETKWVGAANDVLSVTLRSGSVAGTKDLSHPGTGATTDTEYEIQVTLDNYDPTVSSGAGNFQGTWSETDTDSETEVTLTTEPIAMQWDSNANTQAILNPNDDYWDGSNQAEYNFNTVDFVMVEFSGQEDGKAQGSYINTDSQSIAEVSVDNTNKEFKVDVAGPHKTVGNNLNYGFLKAYLSEGVINNWGVSGNSQKFFAKFSDGNQRTNAPTVSSGAGNDVVINWGNFHYSGGTSAVGADTTVDTVDAGSDISASPDESITFDGTGSSDSAGIKSYEWDVDDDNSYEKTGSSASHSYSTTGTRTVTLKVTDNEDNTATDTLSVDVSSGSSEPADTTAPTAEAGSDLTVSPHESFSFDGRNSTDNEDVTLW